MFKNKNPDGTLNLCGKNVARLRMAMEPKVSQNKLAGMLQLAGLDLGPVHWDRPLCYVRGNWFR